MLRTTRLLSAAIALAFGSVPWSSAQEATPKLVITRAVYEAMDGSGGADVTERVRAMVKDGVLSLNANNRDLGGDPTPGRVKRLRVEYTWEGKTQEVVVVENENLELPPLSPEQIKERLLTLLRSDASRQAKQDACRQLAVSGGKQAVPVLAGLIADEQLSHMARYALEPIPDPAVDEALRNALGTARGKLLVGVINSIGVRRDAKATTALTKLLRDPEVAVASAAAASLGSVGTSAAVKALATALAEAPAEVRPAIQEGLLRCADRLAAQGQRKEAVGIYDRVLGMAASDSLRAAALRGAILVRQANGAALLKQQLHSDDPRVFAIALRVALELTGEKVTQTLAADLGNLPPDRQPLVVQAVSRRGDAAAARSLVEIATKGTKPVRIAALRALPEVGDAAAAPALARMLGDADPEIAQAARDSLATLPDKEAETAVRALLTSSEVRARLAGIELVGRRRLAEAIPALVKASCDPDQEIRLAGLKALDELAGTEEIPALLDALLGATEAREIGAVERVLATVCVKAGDPETCAGTLIGRMPQAQPSQRGVLLRLLAAVGGTKALQAVQGAVKEADAEVRATAVRVLAEWRTAEAASSLLELAKAAPTPTERLLCLRGYLRIASDEDVPTAQRLALCKEAAPLVQRDEERKLLLGALSGIAMPESLALVTPFLDNAATKEEASLAVVSLADKVLGGQDTPKVTEALSKVARTAGNPEVVKRAQALLEPSAQGQRLFNGKDLTGWEGNPELWSVQDNAITGRTTKEKPTGGNTFLLWKGGEVSDFELSFKVKLTPGSEQGFANSGVQFRSKVADAAKFVVRGYQADIAMEPSYYGFLYEEGGRGGLANIGEKVVIRDGDPNGPANQRWKIEPTGSFGKREELTGGVKPTEWNEYRIVARGSVIQLFVKGRQTVEADDRSSAAVGAGVLALQLHAGPPMMVQFKDLVLKSLK